MGKIVTNGKVVYLSDIDSSPIIASNKGEERRHYRRVPCHLSVGIEGTGDISAFAEDFSYQGLRLRIRRPLAPHSVVKIRFVHNRFTREITLLCCIQWDHSQPNGLSFLGLRFIDLDESQERFLKYLFVALQEQKPTEKIEFLPLQLLNDKQSLTQILQHVQDVHLPTFLCPLIQEIGALSQRPSYLWKWCYLAMVHTTLSSVSQKWIELCYNTKLLGFLFSILVDDIADGPDNKNFLSQITKAIILNQPIKIQGLEKTEEKIALILNKILFLFNANLRQLPRFQEFSVLLELDFHQLIASLAYAKEINKNICLINYQEAFLYEGHNINVAIDLIIDLMCSLSFDKTELGKLRNVSWKAQAMCRIANWIATWEKEIHRGDWTSGVIAKAIDQGILQQESLKKNEPDQIIKKIKRSTAEALLMNEWAKHWIDVNIAGTMITSIDMASYVEGLKMFFQMYWAIMDLE